MPEVSDEIRQGVSEPLLLQDDMPERNLSADASFIARNVKARLSKIGSSHQLFSQALIVSGSPEGLEQQISNMNKCVYVTTRHHFFCELVPMSNGMPATEELQHT